MIRISELNNNDNKKINSHHSNRNNWYKIKEEETNIKDKIKQWFTKNSYPTDDQVHKLADSLSIDPHKLEQTIYELLSDYVNMKEAKKVVKDVEKKWIDAAEKAIDELKLDHKKYDVYQLAKGIEIEHEHDDIINGDDILSAKIAVAHIKEIPQYYDRLVAMEQEAGIKD